jgi:hypothetical protein
MRFSTVNFHAGDGEPAIGLEGPFFFSGRPGPTVNPG